MKKIIGLSLALGLIAGNRAQAMDRARQMEIDAELARALAQDPIEDPELAAAMAMSLGQEPRERFFEDQLMGNEPVAAAADAGLEAAMAASMGNQPQRLTPLITRYNSPTSMFTYLETLSEKERADQMLFFDGKELFFLQDMLAHEVPDIAALCPKPDDQQLIQFKMAAYDNEQSPENQAKKLIKELITAYPTRAAMNTYLFDTLAPAEREKLALSLDGKGLDHLSRLLGLNDDDMANLCVVTDGTKARNMIHKMNDYRFIVQEERTKVAALTAQKKTVASAAAPTTDALAAMPRLFGHRASAAANVAAEPVSTATTSSIKTPQTTASSEAPAPSIEEQRKLMREAALKRRG